MRPHPPSPATRARGFTLIELLITISIITTLSLIGFSGARRMLQSARIVQSTTNLRQLAIANCNYLSDNGTYSPADNQYNNRRWHGARSSSSSAFDPTEGFLSPYLGESEQVTACPLFENIVGGTQSFEDGTGGYGYNAQYIGGRPGGGYDRTTKLRIPALQAQIPDPGNTVMFTTTAYARTDGLQEYAYCEPPYWDYGNGYLTSRPSPSVHFRANGKALVAWCDGSVTAELPNNSTGTINPHGGNSGDYPLGWFGPEDNNGYWNPNYRTTVHTDEELN
ncbi:MAG: type II secretion system protein [Verrucomicrobiota bacterium JB025]|nr:type II secretion system protein [Verrucomicrobiota bacterium JB025]